jgi:ABC-type nitrate/sulfonate/bicarbonate transport system ATPase subunit
MACSVSCAPALTPAVPLVAHDVGEAVARSDRIVMLDPDGVACDEPVNLGRQRDSPHLCHLQQVLL